MTYDFDLATKINAIAAKAKDSNPHWISTPHGEYETNSGNDWCRTCGLFMFKHLRRKDRKRAEQYYFDGGERAGSDSHRFCAHCGCWLRISLTDYGIEEELHYYRENGVGLNSIPDEAYSLDIMMRYASWNGDHETEIQASRGNS
ncbi:hypothetical protein [Mesorhizobium silamurunense]|uniref:hypothetical protein n=1 Tax=Mesorhizobium silamurunense TaxID=499528 RepID=UPI0017866750|nr:hypothetical protein [Mesorhizobium silamurunense]